MMNYSTTETNSTKDSARFYGLKQSEYFKIAAYCLIILLSLVGNSLVIAVVYKNANKRLRTPSNYFVVSMAVGDGLITAVNMVIQVILLARRSSLPFNGIAGIAGCKFQNFMWFFLVSWSTGSLSAITMDRFLLVFVPLKRIITLRVARVVIAVIIIIGAASSWPAFMLSETLEYKGKTYCYLKMSQFGSRIYVLAFIAIFIYLPLFMMLVLYTAISLKLWLRKSPGSQENREQMNRRIVVMLITLVVLFLLCWMPVSVGNFACLAHPSSTTCIAMVKGDTLYALMFMAFSNSAINPYVYFIFNKNFRYGARMIWDSLIRAFSTHLFNRHNRVGVVVEMNPTIAFQSQTSNENETIQR